jgi:hypothetical protein
LLINPSDIPRRDEKGIQPRIAFDASAGEGACARLDCFES